MILSYSRTAVNPICVSVLVLLTLILTSPSHAVPIQGPNFIAASTSIPPCAVSICLGFGTDINQIADGDLSNFNGYAGADGVVGIITLDLLGNFDLQSFTLWNDINVNHEGVGTFKLHFYDASNNLIQITDTLTAPVGQSPGQIYPFASTVQDIGRVDLETLTLLTGSAGSRIEIREAAFTGSPVPESGTILLLGSALAGWRRGGGSSQHNLAPRVMTDGGSSNGSAVFV